MTHSLIITRTWHLANAVSVRLKRTLAEIEYRQNITSSFFLLCNKFTLTIDIGEDASGVRSAVISTFSFELPADVLFSPRHVAFDSLANFAWHEVLHDQKSKRVYLFEPYVRPLNCTLCLSLFHNISQNREIVDCEIVRKTRDGKE